MFRAPALLDEPGTGPGRTPPERALAEPGLLLLLLRRRGTLPVDQLRHPVEAVRPRRVLIAEVLEVLVPGPGRSEQAHDGQRIADAARHHGQQGLVEVDPGEFEFGFLV